MKTAPPQLQDVKTKAFGAFPDDWNVMAYVADLQEDLLPVVSNPNAKISPRSKMTALGKTPSVYNRERQATGFSGWTEFKAIPEQIDHWSTEPDYGICLQTRRIRALDIDVTDPAQAKAIMDFIAQRYNFPARTRSNSTKFLLAFNMPGEYSKRSFKIEHGIVEFLATGQQFIFSGTHPSGSRYEWQDGLPTDFPSITPAQFEELWESLVANFAIEPPITGKAASKANKLSEAHKADPVAAFLIEHDLVKSTERDGRLHIICPFESEHTTESGDSATTYFPAHTGGYEQGHFKCLHAHCEGRTDEAFKLAIGAPSVLDGFEGINSQFSDWQAPISLEASRLPPWPDDVFPYAVQDFVTALSESTETPPELSALMVLSAISAAAQGKYRVRVKQDYFEPVNLWTLCALPPGSRKTAVQNAATAPLSIWERWQKEIIEPEIKKAKADHATITEQINQLRKQAGKAKGSEFDSLKKEIAELEAELPEIPKVPQVWAQDVTPENLGTIMGENTERMAVLSDESGIFDILAGRYSGGIPNLDLFLQGHAGSPVRVNRGTRPPIFMQNPGLTLGLSPQPEVLRGLTTNPSFRGRGLLGRFLYALPPSNLGYRTLNARPMQDEVKAKYERILTSILNDDGSKDADGNPCPHILKISPDAATAWQAFAHKVEAGMREGGTYAHITDWAGKLPGAVARIAALLHIGRHALNEPAKVEISIEDMSAALRMADALSAHALAVFDLMGADPALDGARVILRWIEREGKEEFTFRDCHYAHKTRYKRAAEIEPAIEVLIERHFIRPRVAKVSHRPSRIFDVNPVVFRG